MSYQELRTLELQNEQHSMSSKIALIFTFITFILAAGCKRTEESTVIVSGTFSKLIETELRLIEIHPDSLHFIEAFTTDSKGSFEVRFTPSECGFYMIQHESKPLAILIPDKAGKLVLEENLRFGKPVYLVSGSEDSKVYSSYVIKEALFRHKIDSLGDLLRAAQTEPDFPEVKKKLDQAYFRISEQQSLETIEFIKLNSSSIAALLVMNKTGKIFTFDSVEQELALKEQLIKSLESKYPLNPHFLKFKSKFDQQKKILSAYSAIPSNISLPDQSGRIRSLRQHYGEYTLLYFWISWNQACRQMNRELSGLYDEMHEKGFEIFAVSIDQNKDQWKDALKIDRMKGIQLIDTTGFKSESMAKYQVIDLPSAILLNRKGEVLLKTRSADELRLFLNKQLNHKD